MSRYVVHVSIMRAHAVHAVTTFMDNVCAHTMGKDRQRYKLRAHTERLKESQEKHV